MAHRINERNTGHWSNDSEPKKRANKSFSSEEKQTIRAILTKVWDCMEYDEDLKMFVDGGRFTLAMDNEAFDILIKAAKNI